MPDVGKIVFNLLFAVQGQFVLHHHAGEGKTGLFAVAQHLGRRFERVRHADVADAVFAKMLFIHDETTADGVVRFAVDLFFTAVSVNGHAVFMQRQVVATETHAVILREIDFLLAVCQQQAAACFHVADECRDGININGIRHIACQTHNNGDIGVVAFTR